MMEPALFLGITVDAVICVSAVRVVELGNMVWPVTLSGSEE